MDNVFKFGTKLCDLSNSDNVILGYDIDRKENKIVITQGGKSVLLLDRNGDEFRPLRDWTLSAANQVTCRAVVDSDGTISCVFGKVLKKWNKDVAVVDKAKRSMVQSNVWQIYSTLKNSILLVYNDGSYSWNDSPKIWKGQGEHVKPVCIDCKYLEDDRVLLAMVLKDNESYKMVSYTFDKERHKTKENIMTIKSENDEFKQMSVLPTKNSVICIVLTSKNKLLKVNMDASFDEVLYKFDKDISDCLSMISVSSNYVVISGLRKDNKVGIGLWDLQFKLIKGWLDFPETSSLIKPLHCDGKYLFVPCDQSLYMYKMELPKSSLADVLGRKQALTSGNDKTSKIDGLIKMLNSKQASGKNKKKNTSFTNENRQFLTECISNGSVQQHKVSELMSGLIKNNEIKLLSLCVENIMDLSESIIIQILSVYLKNSSEDFERVCENNDKDTIENSPFKGSKMKCINKILSLSYNDVFLLKSLRNMEFSHCLDLLKHLHSLLSIGNESNPSIVQVVDWIGYLLDSHFSQIVLSVDARSFLVELHSVVESKMAFYEELVCLEGILTTLREKCTPPITHAVGMYCIQTLHL